VKIRITPQLIGCFSSHDRAWQVLPSNDDPFHRARLIQPLSREICSLNNQESSLRQNPKHQATPSATSQIQAAVATSMMPSQNRPRKSVGISSLGIAPLTGYGRRDRVANGNATHEQKRTDRGQTSCERALWLPMDSEVRKKTNVMLAHGDACVVGGVASRDQATDTSVVHARACCDECRSVSGRSARR
jgi:hypothetical protein